MLLNIAISMEKDVPWKTEFIPSFREVQGSKNLRYPFIMFLHLAARRLDLSWKVEWAWTIIISFR